MQETKRPNIIWFFGDQHRAQATGIAGDPNVKAPNIDQLGRDGVWFRCALSGNPWCTPFRGSLMTGLYPHKTVYETPSRLDPSIATVADAFNEGGYHTAYYGKWHLARPSKNDGPMRNGKRWPVEYFIDKSLRGRFEEWLGYESHSGQYDTVVHGHDDVGNEKEMHPLGKYEPDGLTDLLVSYIHRRANSADDQPFFAVCSPQPPHNPYNPPPRYKEMYDRDRLELRPNVPDVGNWHNQSRETLQGYYGSISCIDDNVGRVVEALRETGQYENTYLMFFSDHGDMHGSHGHRMKSVPWEESIRIPFIIGGGAARQAAGRVTDSILNSVDILPTTLGLAGLAPAAPTPGFDFSGYATSDSDPDSLPGEPESALCQHLVRKLQRNGMDCTWRGVVTRDGWKYFCTEHASIGMFNLNIDPYEQMNLVYDHGHREKRAELIELLRSWLADVGDSYPLPGHG